MKTRPNADQIRHQVPNAVREWVEAAIQEALAKIDTRPQPHTHAEIDDLKRRVYGIEQYLEDDTKYSLTKAKLVRLLKEMENG